MKRLLLLAVVAVLVSPAWLHAQSPDADEAELRQRVMRVLEETPLIDGHIDVPWQYRRRTNLKLGPIDFHDTTGLKPPMHTDLTRLREGGVGGVFWSVYIPIRQSGGGDAYDLLAVIEQIDVLKRLVAKYPEHLELALTADEVERIHGEGKIASLIGMEGGHSIANSLPALRILYDAGARYMSLTHTKNAAWADSATDEPASDGLSPFGREVVREMNRLGMLVDLSHVSAKAMHDALDLVEAPVIFSHSSAMGVTEHPRNVPDDVLQRVRENGGVVMVTFFPGYVSDETAAWEKQEDEVEARLRQQFPAEADAEKLEAALNEWRKENPAPWPTLSDVADHIDHVRKVAGIDHIGLGSDYDGMPPGPVGLEDASTFPNLFVELLKRGYSEEDIAKIAGKNVLRVMRAAEAVAKRLQEERPASEATLPELDTAGELIVPAGR